MKGHLLPGILAEPRTEAERRPDGSIVLRNPDAIATPSRCVGDWLVEWAGRDPTRIFLAERPVPGAPWREVSYGEAHARVRAAAAWLLAAGASQERPLAVVSDNGIDHALIGLAAMHVGVPYAAISPAYALMSQDHAKLKSMIEFLDPGIVYVSDAGPYGKALDAIASHHTGRVVTSAGSRDGAVRFDDLLAASDDAAVDAAFATVNHDTLAKLLFTSGSTGLPKAVINTHRMMCTSQESRRVNWPILQAETPIVVDWLPWSHTFGGNHNFNMMLRNGGTLYIDAGKPAPPLIGTTIANLKEIGPNILFNVPRGFEMLADALRDDAEFRERLFGTVKLMVYAGAALPQNTWEAMNELARETTGKRAPLVSAWGSTETAPLATDCTFLAERSGNIGLPGPAIEVKLVPNADKLEIRVRGANITPGYWKRPDLTEAMHDEEGFYVTGDAVRFADPDDPNAGLFFDGRISEDFKLSSGTWVSVGELRVKAIAALDPVASDIVLTGQDRDAIGFLVFPNLPACQRIAGLGEGASAREVLDHPAVRDIVRRGLQALRADGGGSSRYATRARLMEAPPAVDRGEITDKGYINQRAVLSGRKDEIALLEGDDPAAFVDIDG